MGGILLENRLRAVLEETQGPRMEWLMEAMHEMAACNNFNDNHNNEEVDNEGQRAQLFLHRVGNNTVFRRVPVGWTFPKCTTGTLFQRWMCFDEIHRCTAIRYLHSSDVVHLKNGKAVLSKIGFLMKKVEAKAKELPEWTGRTVSAEIAKQMFDHVFDSVIEPIKDREVEGKRRWVQMSWTTVEKWLKMHDRELNGPK